MKVYGSSQSGNCLKVKWAADALGIGFDWVETDSFSGATRTPEFLAINPAGQVPVVVVGDGRVLAQSNAIMLYLAEGSPLVPSDAYERAKMFEWLFWEQYSHEPAIAVRIAQLFYLKTPLEELDPALLKKGHAALARMEQQLQQSAFLVGGVFSLADIALVAYTRVAHRGGFDLARYAHVRAWIARVESRLSLSSAE
ncbi:MAG: glutathione S-transferase family protein [Terricaulis sp.]